MGLVESQYQEPSLRDKGGLGLDHGLIAHEDILHNA